MKNSRLLQELYEVHEEWIKKLNHKMQINRLHEVHIFDSGYGILKSMNPKHSGILREYTRADNLFLDIDIMLHYMKDTTDKKKRVEIMKKINDNSIMILEIIHILIDKLKLREEIERQIKMSSHQGKRA